MHLDEHDQQLEGGSSLLPLCPNETASGVLCPDLGSLVQEGRGTTGDSPREGYKGDKRTEEFLLERKAERLGAI